MNIFVLASHEVLFYVMILLSIWFIKKHQINVTADSAGKVSWYLDVSKRNLCLLTDMQSLDVHLIGTIVIEQGELILY